LNLLSLLITYNQLYLFRRSVIKRKRFVTSQLSWVTPTLNSTSVHIAQTPSVISLMGQSKRIKLSAKIQGVVPSCFCGVMFHLSIVQVMMCLWLLCLLVQLLWIALSYSSLVISHAHSLRPVNTWLQCRL